MTSKDRLSQLASSQMFHDLNQMSEEQIVNNHRSHFGYDNQYSRKVDLTTLHRLKAKHISMTEKELDTRFPGAGRKEHRRLKTEETARSYQ